MAGLESALNTLDIGSRQKLYRLAIWDADYFLSQSDPVTASGPIELIYTLAIKPESFRGALPAEALLLPPVKSTPPGQPEDTMSTPTAFRAIVAGAKSALGLKNRP